MLTVSHLGPKKKRHIKVKNLLTGEIFTDSAHVLITARASLASRDGRILRGLTSLRERRCIRGLGIRGEEIVSLNFEGRVGNGTVC